MAEAKKLKNYIKGSAKRRQFGDDAGNYVINLDLHLDSLIEKIKPNERGYIKLTLSKLRTPDKFDNDYSVFENDWKPTGDFVKKPTPSKFPADYGAKKTSPKTSDDLPF